jgi:glucose/mannose-6-phosphate isomerase
MKDLILDFPNQINDAIKIGKKFQLPTTHLQIQNICISGLGGSGIGGDYARMLVLATASVPIVVNRDYHLPFFVGSNTLAIFSSYSGNTEETLASFEEAVTRNAKIVCICSGGKLLQRALELGLPYIELPGGFPPRAALAYSLVQQLYLLNALNQMPSDAIIDLERMDEFILTHQKNIEKIAAALVDTIGNSLPVIYATAGYEPIAIRLRQQLNENAKILCWHHVLPEMNHNEIVGWTQAHSDKKVIFIHDETQHAQLQKHTDFLRNVVKELCENVMYIAPVGDTLIQKYFYLTHLVDWFSVLLAAERSEDATQVEIIQRLKNSLIA